MAPHSSILAWKNPWAGEPGRVTVHGVTKSCTQLTNTLLAYQSYFLDFFFVIVLEFAVYK